MPLAGGLPSQPGDGGPHPGYRMITIWWIAPHCVNKHRQKDDLLPIRHALTPLASSAERLARRVLRPA